jgi:hypothetical protein
MHPTPTPTSRLLPRLRVWLRRRLGLAGPVAPAPFPDYVACPHCGEPEVEVWCDQPEACCHNCGQTFVHAVPPDCPPRPGP